MRKLLIALFSLALTSSVGADSCCDRDGFKRFPGEQNCYYIPNSGNVANSMNSAAVNIATLVMDATAEKVAFSGKLYIDGRPTAAKNCTAAGGCSISWLPGTTTFANGGTSLSIGIQDVSSSSTPIQPDATFGISGALVGGTDTITTSTWLATDMETDGDDTAYSHGDLISIVWDMTARAGADSVVVGALPNNAAGLPAVSLYTTSWSNTQSLAVNAIITFDDGTIGWIDGSRQTSGVTTSTFNSTTDPNDERALVFSLPFDFEIDVLYARTLAAGDYDLILYEDALGTPVAKSSNVIDDQWERSSNGDGLVQWLLSTPVKGKRGMNYAVAVRPRSASNVSVYEINVSAASHLKTWAGTGSILGTRTDQTGAFSTTATAIPIIGARVCRIYSSGR